MNEKLEQRQLEVDMIVCLLRCAGLRVNLFPVDDGEYVKFIAKGHFDKSSKWYKVLEELPLEHLRPDGGDGGDLFHIEYRS
jgi:hypothetical protein